MNPPNNKASKIKEILRVTAATITAVTIFGSALLGANLLTLQAATSGETYLPVPQTVSIPDNPVDTVPEGFQPPTVNIINTTVGDCEVPPLALSLEEAAQIGAQYIWDMFGESIDGMYVELSFANWDHLTRAIWQGAVSTHDRDTLARNKYHNTLHEEMMTRTDAGEDPMELRRDIETRAQAMRYEQADFYFTIDAVTGMRIDVFKNSVVMRGMTMHESEAINEYIQRNWGHDRDNWHDAFTPDISRQEQEALVQVAKEYAQRHFNNTTVVNAEFGGAFVNFVYIDGVITREISVNFRVTDDTGRDAYVAMHQGTVVSISTLRNDMVLTTMRVEMEASHEWFSYEELDDYGYIRRRHILIEEDGTVREGAVQDGTVREDPTVVEN